MNSSSSASDYDGDILNLGQTTPIRNESTSSGGGGGGGGGAADAPASDHASSVRRGHFAVKAGDVINGAYHVTKRIASGAFGVVVHATEGGHGRKVALKIYNRFNDETEAREEFESLMLFKGKSHVLQLADDHLKSIDEKDDVTGAAVERPFIVTEAHEVDLWTVVTDKTRSKPFSAADLNNVYWSVLKGIKAIHETDFTHLDLKLENILVTGRKDLSSANVCICDMGMLTSQDFEDDELKDGITPSTSAPEVLLSLCDMVGPPADMYSFGCIMFEVVACGEALFIYDKPATDNIGEIAALLDAEAESSEEEDASADDGGEEPIDNDDDAVADELHAVATADLLARMQLFHDAPRWPEDFVELDPDTFNIHGQIVGNTVRRMGRQIHPRLLYPLTPATWDLITELVALNPGFRPDMREAEQKLTELLGPHHGNSGGGGGGSGKKKKKKNKGKGKGKKKKK